MNETGIDDERYIEKLIVNCIDTARKADGEIDHEFICVLVRLFRLKSRWAVLKSCWKERNKYKKRQTKIKRLRDGGLCICPGVEFKSYSPELLLEWRDNRY